MTFRYLLDTSVVSSPIARTPNPEIVKGLQNHGHECVIAAPVWHELTYGCERLPRSKRRSALEAYLHEVVQASFPIFPVSAILKDRYDSLKYAGKITVPTLMLIAERDEIIPMNSSRNLEAAINPSMITVIVVGTATHNTIQEFGQFTSALSDFLQ